MEEPRNAKIKFLGSLVSRPTPMPSMLMLSERPIPHCKWIWVRSYNSNFLLYSLEGLFRKSMLVWSSFRIYASMLILIQFSYILITQFLFLIQNGGLSKNFQNYLSSLTRKFSLASSHYLMRNWDGLFATETILLLVYSLSADNTDTNAKLLLSLFQQSGIGNAWNTWG